MNPFFVPQQRFGRSLLFRVVPNEPHLRCGCENVKEMSCEKKKKLTRCLCVLLALSLPCEKSTVPPALSITIKPVCLLSCLFSVLLACEIFIDDFNRSLELFFNTSVLLPARWKRVGEAKSGKRNEADRKYLEQTAELRGVSLPTSFLFLPPLIAS